MTIAKSSRYAKVLGDHSEALVCKVLSRSGFEAAVIDHTGIDIIAYDQATKKLARYYRQSAYADARYGKLSHYAVQGE